MESFFAFFSRPTRALGVDVVEAKTDVYASMSCDGGGGICAEALRLAVIRAYLMRPRIFSGLDLLRSLHYLLSFRISVPRM